MKNGLKIREIGSDVLDLSPSYYPERSNKPHNGTQKTVKMPISADQIDWRSVPDRILAKDPEYDLFIDLRDPQGSRKVTVRERDPQEIQDPIDQYHSEIKRRINYVPRCTTGFLFGECSNAHTWARAQLCNKEWCPDCGAKNSYVHKQRIARWWDKIMQMKNCGYMVVTIPDQVRDHFKNKKLLSEFRTYFKRKLQREGFDRGLSRYHWAGDCEACKGKGAETGCLFCDCTGASREWKPHLNFLIEGKFIPKEDLERWRTDLGLYFKKRFPDAFKGSDPMGNIYYNYGTTPGYKIHKLKYVTRATWRFGDRYHYGDILDVIKGFRCSSSWGKFEKTDLKRKSPLVHFVNNTCPCCKEPIKWGGIKRMNDFIFGSFNLFHVEGGYYRVQKIGEDPPLEPIQDPRAIQDPPKIPDPEPISEIFKPLTLDI